MNKQAFMEGFVSRAKTFGQSVANHPQAQKLMANPTVQKVMKHPATPYAAAGAAGVVAGRMSKGNDKK